MPPDPDEQLIGERLRAAEAYRRPFELDWLLYLAFAAGQQWAQVDRDRRRLVDTADVDDRWQGIDLYVADIIQENRGAALGELTTDSDRPTLVLPGDGREDTQSELVADQANRILGYGWEMEWDANVKLAQGTQYSLDLGVAAIRCRRDRTGDPVLSSDGEQVQAPIDPRTGEPITDLTAAREYMAQSMARGQVAKLQPLRRARTIWEPGSAFNLLTPPGVPHESLFPWEAWIAPMLLRDLQAQYTEADGLTADTDIGSVLGITVPQDRRTQPGVGTVKDSIWVYTYYERPTMQFPNGRTAVLAGREKKLLRVTPQLPYRRTDGTPHSGIAYLHWQRLTDRFYSRGLVAALKDPQRMRNRNATQSHEIADRSMPYILVEEGAQPQEPEGRPMEYRTVKKGTQIQPTVVAGAGPGAWMQQRGEQILDDAAHASTLSALKTGDNPAGVTSYAQLRLLYEAEAAKRSAIKTDRARQVALLAELSLWEAREIWPAGKRLLVAGPQNELQAVAFDRSMLPDGVVVRPAAGAPEPQSGAAIALKIQDMWQAALASGAATRDPDGWMRWLYESQQAGTLLPLPDEPTDPAIEKAELENRVLGAGGVPQVAYYDPISVHIPIHRRDQEEALMEGDLERWQRGETHIQDHLRVARDNAAAIQAASPPPAALPAAAPPAVAPPVVNGSSPVQTA